MKTLSCWAGDVNEISLSKLATSCCFELVVNGINCLLKLGALILNKCKPIAAQVDAGISLKQIASWLEDFQVETPLEIQVVALSCDGMNCICNNTCLYSRHNACLLKIRSMHA